MGDIGVSISAGSPAIRVGARVVLSIVEVLSVLAVHALSAHLEVDRGHAVAHRRALSLVALCTVVHTVL